MVVFLDPGLVVGVMGCKLDGGVVVDVVVGMLLKLGRCSGVV